MVVGHVAFEYVIGYKHAYKLHIVKYTLILHVFVFLTCFCYFINSY
jgi:hypothetical protein